MGLINTVVGTLRKVGTWAVRNPERAMAAVQKLEGMYTGKHYEPNNHGDRILVVEQRVNQLNEKTEKLDKKVDAKTAALQAEMEKMALQLRTLKIWLAVTGIALTLAVAAIGIFAFCL